MTVAMLCMFPLTIALSMALTRGAHVNEWLCGWGLAALNAGLATVIYLQAMKKKGPGFLLWAVGVSGLRAAGMVAVVIAVLVLAIRHPLPYLIAALTGTLCLMNAEAYYLYRRFA